MNLRLQVLAVRRQLEAVRMQADVVAQLVDALLEQLPVECAHPEDARIDASTLTKQRFWCRQCQQFIDGPMTPEAPSPSGLRPPAPTPPI